MQLAQPFATTTLKTRSGYQVSIPGGADDVLIQLNNVDVLRITLGANMTIKAQGDLILEAANIKLKSTNSVTVQAGNSMDMRAGGNASIGAGSNMDMRAGGSASIGAGGNLTVDGATVNINHGALEVT
jgi:uncharacterized protein (DUF2345 family)